MKSGRPVHRSLVVLLFAPPPPQSPSAPLCSSGSCALCLCLLLPAHVVISHLPLPPLREMQILPPCRWCRVQCDGLVCSCLQSWSDHRSVQGPELSSAMVNGTSRRNQHSPGTPTTGLREHGNDTSKSTGRSGRQNAATRRNMRREERGTAQGPIKKQQPDSTMANVVFSESFVQMLRPLWLFMSVAATQVMYSWLGGGGVGAAQVRPASQKPVTAAHDCPFVTCPAARLDLLHPRTRGRCDASPPLPHARDPS